MIRRITSVDWKKIDDFEKMSVRLKNNVKIFLKKIRTRIVIIIIIKDYNRQIFNSLKILYNVVLINENSNKKILNNEKKKEKKIRWDWIRIKISIYDKKHI